MSTAHREIRRLHMGKAVARTRKFSPFKSSDNRIFRSPNKPTYARSNRFSNRADYSDPYYSNTFLGYQSYDSVNSYQHRHYGRTHHYRPPVQNYTTDAVSYDYVRVTLPPDSPNFCFLPVSELTHFNNTTEESEVHDFNVRSKMQSLFYRPMGFPTPVIYTPDTEKEIIRLLYFAGFALRQQQDPEEQFWVPDFLTFCGCCIGGDVEKRKNSFAEDQLEIAVEDILKEWNKSSLMRAANARMTYADIGNTVMGFCVEVLPCLPPLETDSSPYKYQQLDTPPMLLMNPHFFQPPPSYNDALFAPTPGEVMSVGLMAQVACGQEIPESTYDSVMTKAIDSFPAAPDLVEASYYRPFLVVIPDGVSAGAVLTVSSPQDGFLLNITVPSNCPPGSTVVVTLPSATNADVSAAPYRSGMSSTSAILEEEAPVASTGAILEENEPQVYVPVLYSCPVNSATLQHSGNSTSDVLLSSP